MIINFPQKNTTLAASKFKFLKIYSRCVQLDRFRFLFCVFFSFCFIASCVALSVPANELREKKKTNAKIC